MFRLCIVQSAITANKAIVQLNIRKKSDFIKHDSNSNLLCNKTANAEEVFTLKGELNCNTQLDQTTCASNNDTNGTMQNEANKKKSMLKHKKALMSERQVHELNTVNKFKEIENLRSFSIFGSEVTQNDEIRCDKNDIDLDIPSVMCILNETMPLKTKIVLDAWKKKLINTYGEHFFKLSLKGLLTRNKLFNSIIRDILSKKEIEVPPSIKSAYFSLEPMLNEIQTVHALEMPVTHPTLHYNGIVDCIATYRNHVYLIDWKISEKQNAPFAPVFDLCVQLAAYIGAVNASDDPPFRIDRGLVVVAHTNGEPASINELSNGTLYQAWDEWLKRLQQYYSKLKK